MSDPIAIYGAVTGTVAMVTTTAQAVWTVMLKDRPRIRVSASPVTIHQDAIRDAIGPLKSGQRLIQIEIVNVGRSLVTVQSAGILVKQDGHLRQWVFTGFFNELPRELSPGQSVSIMTDAQDMHEDITTTTKLQAPFCKDPTGKTYKGHFHRFFDDWLSSERFENARKLEAVEK
jgi:hypothetical protein